MKKIHWSAWAMMFVGIGILSYQLWNIAEKHMFISHATHTEARIVSVGEIEVYKRRRGNIPAYVPQVEFSSSLQRTYTFFLSQYSTNKDHYKVGAMLPILYDHSAPSEARENDFRLLWMSEILYSIMGIFFICSGVLGIIFHKRREKKKEMLLEQGERLLGKVEKVYVPLIYILSTSPVYKVEASALYKEKMYSFKSHLFSGAQAFQVGDPISVLIEKNNPTEYYVDSDPVPAV